MKNSNFKNIKEYKINKFITLKLENRRTNIYIDGKIHSQCKYLIANINKRTNEVISIDQLKDIAGGESNKVSVEPQLEFWGHCSNFEAWVKYDYNTNIIDSVLCFPILKKLVELGDKKAKKVYKKELIYRMREGYLTTVQFLIKRNFLDVFNKLELETLLYDIKQLVKKRGFTIGLCHSILHLYEKTNGIEIKDKNKIDYIYKTISSLVDKYENIKNKNYCEKLIIKFSQYLSENQIENIFKDRDIFSKEFTILKRKCITKKFKSKASNYLIQKLRKKQISEENG